MPTEINGIRPRLLGEKVAKDLKEQVAELLECLRKVVRRASRGFLVAVEGVDGAGLSTTAEALVFALNTLFGERVALYTKEPTYGPVGFILWQALSGIYRDFPRHPVFMAHLFAADRLWHLIEEPINNKCRGLLSCLQAGYIVVSDRYKYSSLAYQSRIHRDERGRVVEGADIEWLWRLNEYAPPAHLLVLLDVDVKTALERIGLERWSIQYTEKKDFLESVREAFKEIAGELEKRPEVDAGSLGFQRGRGLWVRMLREAGVDPSILYKSPPAWPQVERHNTAEEKPEEVIRAALEDILKLICKREERIL